MSSSVKVIALSLLCLIEFTSPAFAQLSSAVDPLDEIGSPHSKIVDVDIVTDSPTLQRQTAVQQSQVPLYSSPWTNAGAVQSAPMPQQNGIVQQSTFSADTTQYPTTQYSATASSATVPQNAAKQPIQVDSQTVGRVVGVAGTALLLGAFLKNGGVGGMMNTFGLDNRFHSRGPSLAPY